MGILIIGRWWDWIYDGLTDMTKLKMLALTLACITATTLTCRADSTNSSDAKISVGTNAVAKSISKGNSGPKQADVASTTASFGKIAKTDSAYQSALDAHALDDALKMAGKEGAFKGTVAKLFQPHGLAIVEFDENYRTAMTAIVKSANFTNFPPLTNLIGKDV
jgi:hypothetical protein